MRLSEKSDFDPADTPAALVKLMGSSPPQARASPGSRGVRRIPAGAQPSVPLRIQTPGWSEPVRIGAGNYPRLICYGGDKALCLWVTGEVPRQQLGYSLCTAGQWESSRQFRAAPTLMP